MAAEKTKAEMQTEIFHLSNVAGNLAKENALLRAQVELGGLTTLKNTISELQDRIAALDIELAEKAKDYEEAMSDSASYQQEALELGERVEELEDASDPDAICGHVHDFLRAERVVPDALDAPLRLAPHLYRIGLYAAVQKACEQ